MIQTISSSFRDPSGFVYLRDGVLYRQVNGCYGAAYEQLMASGLYHRLVERGYLLPHREADLDKAATADACKVLEPERIGFISYPYEWCFSQLKDAALLTAGIQKQALSHGMSLKDCSAFNIQFRNGRPVFIDTLSFEPCREGEPWVAYRQFCQHFLAPLALMSRVDVRLGQLFRIYIDGIPLDLATALLPWRSRFSLGLFTHLHLHARSQRHFAGKQVARSRLKMSRQALVALADHLETTVERMQWIPGKSSWSDYYASTNYESQAFAHKSELVAGFLRELNPRPRQVWDLGSNTGYFSRIASAQGIPTVSLDMDPACVESNYLECVRNGETNLLPLWLDLTNPSAGLGWANEERISWIDRGPADVVLALALIHHLAIANNVPLSRLAGFFGRIGRFLIVEFVPKADSQVQLLLSTREDIFPGYTQVEFEKTFGRNFTILRAVAIPGTERTLYLMEKTRS
jgi:ribosomal protein L11 methylase PrmA